MRTSLFAAGFEANDCPGCAGSAHPLDDCAACGKPATIVLRATGRELHDMSLCFACARTIKLLRIAAEADSARRRAAKTRRLALEAAAAGVAPVQAVKRTRRRKAVTAA